MNWCFAIRSGLNFRPQIVHGTRPSEPVGCSATAERSVASERPLARPDAGRPAEGPERLLVAGSRASAALHVARWEFSCACGISTPHAVHGVIIAAFFFWHCGKWNFIAVGKKAWPHYWHGVVGGGIAVETGRLERGSPSLNGGARGCHTQGGAAWRTR